MGWMKELKQMSRNPALCVLHKKVVMTLKRSGLVGRTLRRKMGLGCLVSNRRG